MNPPPSPQECLDALLGRLDATEAETVALEGAAGRVLAEAGVADRDSPACSVSAMDGYAVCVADLWWYRPVRRLGADTAQLLANRGSGDLAHVAASDGFVEVPPGGSGQGPLAYFGW